MTAHIHAELMMQYAQDAMETGTPWERWDHYSALSMEWRTLMTHPAWGSRKKYRRKPRTIRIGDYDVPEPVREPLEDGSEYWRATIAEGAKLCRWTSHRLDTERLLSGVVYIKAADAKLCTEAIRSLLRKPE